MTRCSTHTASAAAVILLLAWHLFESGRSNDLRYAALAPGCDDLARRGLAKAGAQVLLAAMAFNMRRWVTLAA